MLAPESASPDPDLEAWRDPLVAWGKSALGSPGRAPAPPVERRSELALVVERLQLDLRATTALQLLYASWLLGDADQGVPAATVAHVLSARDGDAAAAWPEALGQGVLGRSGLARACRGRLRLAPPAGRFLDGAPVVGLQVVGASEGSASGGPVHGTYRVGLPDDRWSEAALRIALQLGRPLALLSADSPHVQSRLLSARLTGALPFVCGRADARFPTPPDGPFTLLAYTGPCPEALANLPAFELNEAAG
jgi:hypothetical protein